MKNHISEHSTRYLHVYPTGDHCKGKTVPKIRLQRKWLEEAGIAPGDQVAVEIQEEGQLLIRRVEKTT